MILIETSAWAEYDRATDSPIDRRLAELIAAEADLAVTDAVLMEVLAGARSDHSWLQLCRLLTSFTWVPSEPATDFEGAAHLYRSCRAQGVTPRGLIDCMIASIALRIDATVLTADRDFARIAEVVPLQIDAALAS
ncbi:MAG: PIN domain nuclease [Actinomycetia bacterium]|nr:PIN domain nuclease [Actinomycetes bacterium]